MMNSVMTSVPSTNEPNDARQQPRLRPTRSIFCVALILSTVFVLITHLSTVIFPPRVRSSADGGSMITPAPTTRASASSPHPVRRAVTEVRYRIVVFTYLRTKGLQRLLRSLTEAYYPSSATITLNIFFDYPKPQHNDTESGVERRRTLQIINNLTWRHGPLSVHRRETNVGLKSNILEAWYPTVSSSEAKGAGSSIGHEVCVFLEDDIELSVFWFDWALAAVEKYYLSARLSSPAIHSKIVGVSLFRPIYDQMTYREHVVRNGNSPFLLQQPCSWGAIYFPKPWREFRDWYESFEKTGRDPVVKTERGHEPMSNLWGVNASWKKYLIRLMYDRGWAMVYPNLPERLVFATNHVMKGEHVTGHAHRYQLPLLDDSTAKRLFPSKKRQIYRMLSSVRHPARSHEVVTLIDPDDLPALDRLQCFDVTFTPEPDGARSLLKRRSNLFTNSTRELQRID